ncbi:MAG: TniQ [Idiomarinaceae bacterium HL-53]|nr:MAG: TniQ [Idiomarinaceae bacterium HL-53]CUS47640.1 TniQ protein [Idiomarinaceae bacterium HL-53]
MAHADSRKPTTEVVVATKWSFKPKSLPNETLSSFVVRAALAHHLDPMSAANIIWGAWRAWTFDIDRRLPAEQLQQLAQSLGADKDALKSLTIHPHIHAISNDTYSNRNRWFWVTSLAHRNGVRRESYSFCPQCLGSDKLPYYRREWRYSWYVCCPIHRSWLLSRCPHCSYPVHLHQYRPDNPSLLYCSSCKKRLDSWLDNTPVPDYLIHGHIRTLEHLENRDEDWTRWFYSLKFLVSLSRKILNGKQRCSQLILATLSEHFPELVPMHLGSTNFPDLELESRRAIVAIAFYLKSLHFNDFLSLLVEHAVTYSFFTEGSLELPTEYADIAPELKRITHLKSRRVRRLNVWPEPRSEEYVQRKLQIALKEIRSRER